MQLGSMPLAFPLVSRHEHLGIRRRVYRDYSIFYRADSDRILIVHMFHGARAYEALLSSPPSQRPARGNHSADTGL